MIKIRIVFLLVVLCLYLGWLPKLKADRVPWYRDNDFAHYFIAAEATRLRENPYTIDLHATYSTKGFSPARASLIAVPTAPPALALAMAPLTLLSIPWAFLVWSLIQLGSLWVGSYLGMRLLGLGRGLVERGVLLIAASASLGVFAHLRNGQAQCLIFLLMMAGLALMKGRREWWRGGSFLWGLATSMKIFTAPMVFVVWRYFGARGVGWFLSGFCIPWVVFVGWCGAGSLATFVCQTLPYLRDLSVAFDGNISLPSAIVFTQRVLFGADYLSVRLIQGVSAALVLVAVWGDFAQKEDLFASACSMLAISCLLSPTCWSHYTPLVTGGFLYLLRGALRAQDLKNALSAVLALYLCTGVVLGYLRDEDILRRLVSAWWGAACLAVMVVMISAARRGGWVFRSPE